MTNNNPNAPDRLCGRDQEVAQLVSAYIRSTSCEPGRKQQELVLIHGIAGIGKTALAEALKSHLQNDKAGLFLSGKFELSKCQAPYSVFISAFTQISHELIGGSRSSSMGDERLQQLRLVVDEATGAERKILANMIPALQPIIGSDFDKIETTGTEALHQFQFVFCKFCRSLSAVVPLVLFLDDLQWADKASVELLQALLLSHTLYDKSSCLLIVGAYRDEEIYDQNHEEFAKNVSPSVLLRKPPFYFCLRDLMIPSPSPLVNITSIPLSPLNEAFTNDLVARTLKIPPESSLALSPLVHAETNGNPFHSTQYVLSLKERGLVYLDESTGQWCCNNSESDEQSLVGSVQVVVNRKIENLSALAQNVLEIAALLGDEIDEQSLVIAIDGASLSAIANAVKSLADEGLLSFDPDRGLHRFKHDYIRQTALSRIHDKDTLSFNVGQALWERLPPLYLDSKIFTVVSLMKGGINIVVDRSRRYKLAALHLEAGLKAFSRLDFPDASRYLETGIRFLNGGDYWAEKYSLTLDLFSAAAESALCNQDFERVVTLVRDILEHGRNLSDKILAYVAQINAMGQNGSVHDAMQVGMDVLRQLGESMPMHATNAVIISEIIKTKFAVRKRTNQSILAQPPSQNETKLAAMNIMSILLPYAFQAASRQAVVIGTRLSRLCLTHGLHTGSALGLAIFAMVLCRSQRNEGYRLGRLALDLVQQINARPAIPSISFYFYGLVHHWKRPLRESLDGLARAVQTGEEIGDIEYAMMALRFKCLHALYCGEPLEEVERMAIEGSQQMRCFKQENLLRLTVPIIEFVKNLRRGDLVSEHIASTEHRDEHECSNRASVLFARYNLETEFLYLIGDYDGVGKVVELKRQLKFEGQTLYGFAASRWKEALAAVALVRLGVKKRRNTITAKQSLKQIQGWAIDSPENFLHKAQLLKAELWSLNSDARSESRVQAKYVAAFKRARKEQFVQEAALASELLGDFLGRAGKVNQAEKHWNQARQLYLQWGATTKALQLVRRIEAHAKNEAEIQST